jgi:enoyl-CoA hydratase/3-hydroxyacyl-CoA dehydrogenase
MSFHHRGRSLSRVAVIGSGQIGPDIALYFSKVLSPHGVQTVVVDVSEAALEKGRAKVEKKLRRGVESGAFKPEEYDRMVAHLEWTTDYEKIKGAELVVEAATENEDLKGKIFAQVEQLVPEHAILASNSSHLEPEVIFKNLGSKQRCTVIHYFFPAERNLMVEVVPGAETDPLVTGWLLDFYEAIGKVPIAVASRYGYALDPIFEGLFQASLLLADKGVATTKQIDAVATKALGMTVGSFTAMNLTGGNPITAVGLDKYTSKIHSWFHTPESLGKRVASGEPWEVPQRGEQVEVSDELREEITRWLRGAYFGLVGEVLDAGLVTIGDFDMALELALDMKPAFTFMNELGTDEALKLVREFAEANPGFPVPRCIEEHGKTGAKFKIEKVQRIDYEDITVLKIRRPKVLNALNAEVFDELRDKITAIDADDSIRATVLTGFGKKAFVSGADVKFLSKIENAEQGEATSKGSQQALDAIAAVKKPVLCAMNGLAFGGGNELAMACSMRIAKKGIPVFVAQPEPNLGIIPGAGATQRLPRLVGIDAAQTILRTGKPISSSRALQIGLISEEVEGDLLERALLLARELADGTRPRVEIRSEPIPNVPDSLPEVELGHLSRKVDEILCKAILEGARATLAEGLAIEARCFGEVCATKDMRIGVTNFLENGPRTPASFVHA